MHRPAYMFCLFCFLTLLLTGPAHAGDPALTEEPALAAEQASAEEQASSEEQAFREAVLDLMEATGSDELGVQMGSAVAAQIFDALFEGEGEDSDELRRIAHEEMEQVLRDTLPKMTDEFVPLYAKYFTLEEIQGLTEFYRSPLGQKAVSVLPQLMQEAFVIGQEWGEDLGEEVAHRIEQRLEEEGLTSPPEVERPET